MKKTKKSNAKYFNTKREANSVAKRRGKKVFKIANSYFVGTASEAFVAKRRNTKGGLENDKKRKALQPGKRISKNGKTYYEQRTNRSDRNPKKRI